MQNLQNQKGMTAIGWLIVLALIAFFVFLGLKLFPIYYSGFKVSSSVNSLEKDIEARGKSPAQLKKLLLKRLDINMVTDIGPQDIYISRNQGNYVVEIDYIVKENLVGNLYVLVEFNERAEVPAR